MVGMTFNDAKTAIFESGLIAPEIIESLKYGEPSLHLKVATQSPGPGIRRILSGSLKNLASVDPMLIEVMINNPPSVPGYQPFATSVADYLSRLATRNLKGKLDPVYGSNCARYPGTVGGTHPDPGTIMKKWDTVEILDCQP